MKSNFRDKFRDFLASEEGRVGVKAPLAVGIAGGSLLLAQALFSPDAQAHIDCWSAGNCDDGEACVFWWEHEWSQDCGCWIPVQHSACV